MSRLARIPIPLFNQPKPAGFDSNDGFSSRHGLALTLTSRWRRWVSRSRFRASCAVFTRVRSEKRILCATDNSVRVLYPKILDTSKRYKSK
jgi:hypothetical protein